MGGRRDVGEKPTMWEAWVGKDRETFDVHEEEEVHDEKEAVWDGILVGIIFLLFSHSLPHCVHLFPVILRSCY